MTVLAPAEGVSAKIGDMATDRHGHHKIFLGMAAGVGKTYQMLQRGPGRGRERP